MMSLLLHSRHNDMSIHIQDQQNKQHANNQPHVVVLTNAYEMRPQRYANPSSYTSVLKSKFPDQLVLASLIGNKTLKT